MTMMFNILRAALFTNEQITLSDWQPVFEEMKQQTVAALPYNILPAEATKWRSYCMKKKGQAIRVLHAQDELISLLESNGISCVILKGAAAAMAYPYPTLRTMGDVDFLVKRCDLDRAAEVIEANGYSLEHEKTYCNHHYAYLKNKISFELHWLVPCVSEHDEERIALFEEGIDNREWHEIEGYRFPVLPTLLNGIVLLFHINHHLRSGIGLRQIVDWMMYVNSLSEDQWTELLYLLKSVGMERLTLTTTAMCQRYLGLRHIVDENGLPTDQLLAHIMEKGNFGQKSGETGKIASVYLDMSNPIRVFKRLQDGGMSRWSAARKYFVLRPFAWIYQIGFIANKLVRNRIAPGEMVKQRNKGLEQRKLIEDLGLKVDSMIR
jgi:hypothetical protein